LRTSTGSVSLGCSKAEYAGTAGMVVVTKRGTCARVARAVFGDEAGAAAVVMINTSAGYPPFEGQITSNPDTGEQHTVTIPFLGALTTDAAALVAADGGTVMLAATTVANPGYKKVASFTSGGPRNPDSAPKPDVIAPGVSVTSAGMGTGIGSLVASGTSMACPMTAGIAALVKQQHKNWTGAQIKAAIMNTADPSLNLLYNSRLSGTGVVQAQKAVNSSVLATTSDALDALKFGYVAGSGNFISTSASSNDGNSNENGDSGGGTSFTLTNRGSSTATYALSVVANGSLHGAGITVSPSTVSVAAGHRATVHVTLTMSAAAFAALPSDDTFVVGPGSVVTVRGNIVATPAAGHDASQQTLSVPFMMVPRGLSKVAAHNSKTTTASTGTITSSLALTNKGIHSGIADLYTWGITEARDSGSSIDVRDVGVQVVPANVLDPTLPATDRGLTFLINTWGRAANQSINEFDIPIDTTGSGTPNFVLVGADLGLVLTGTPNGQYAAFTINAKTGALVDAFLAEAPMNGSTIELTTLASDLGLSQTASHALTYSVNAFNGVPGGLVDVTGSASIDPFSPPVSSGDFATILPGASASFTLTANPNQLEQTPALGWLVASLDNANGAAQALEVKAPSNRSSDSEQQAGA
jgi:minor extracellular serine protease Vpr